MRTVRARVCFPSASCAPIHPCGDFAKAAAINSITGDGFNWKNFNNMTSWENNSTSYITSMANAGVRSTMDQGAFGFINETKAYTDTLARLSGGLTSSGLEYALTGKTKFNVAGINGTGMMELNQGGGSIFSMGSGGTDISYGTLSQAYQGIEAYAQNSKIREAGVDRNMRAAMRTIYSAGMDETSALYDDILNKRAVLSTGSRQDYEGYTTLNSSGQRVIDLNMDGKSSLDLGVLLSHEAFRDGTDNGEFGQQLETFQAAMGHMNVASALQAGYGASYLSDGNNREAKAYAMYKEGLISSEAMAGYVEGNYDSTQDYWKLMDDGSIAYDGKKDLYDEEGNRIEDAVDENGKRLGWNASLALFTGMSEDEAGIAMSKLGARWMATERNEEGKIVSLGHLYSTKEGVTLYDDPDFSFEASNSIFSKWLTDPTQKFISTGEIQRERIASYSQQDKETAWAGAPLDWTEDKGYCNIDSMIKGFSTATGVSEVEFVESLQQSWDDIRTETNDPDYTPDYINIDTGNIESYENFAEALLGSVGLEDNYLFNYQSRKDSQGNTTSLALDLLKQGYKNNEIYMSGYFKHNNNGVLSGGHYAFIDMTGTLTNPFNGSSIWADDYQNQFMDLFTLQKLP